MRDCSRCTRGRGSLAHEIGRVDVRARRPRRRTRTPIAWRTPLWTRRRAPDRAGQPARRRAVAPIRAEHVGMARRAQLGDEDLRVRARRPRRNCSRAALPAVEEPVVRAALAGDACHRRIARPTTPAPAETSVPAAAARTCRVRTRPARRVPLRSSTRRSTGPIAATRSAGRLPNSAISARPPPRGTPAARPRQPACARPPRPSVGRPSGAARSRRPGRRARRAGSSVDDDVGLWRARPVGSAAAIDHRRAVHLTSAHEVRRRRLRSPRDLGPGASARSPPQSSSPAATRAS